MPKFIKNIINDFLNIYLDEQHIREHYGDEYADRFSVINPLTGKRKVSASKVLKRIAIIFITALVLFLFIRVITYNGKWGAGAGTPLPCSLNQVILKIDIFGN